MNQDTLDIIRVATMIALETPPSRRKRYAGKHGAWGTPRAYVAWALIERLCIALEAAGYDLEAMRRNMKESNDAS